MLMTKQYCLLYEIAKSSLFGLMLCIFVSASFAATPAPTRDDIKKITANWQCKWCPYPDKTSQETQVNIGAGIITNDSYKFGDYTGTNEDGAYAIADVDYLHRNSSGSSVVIAADNLGLDSRKIEADLGIKGVANINIVYDELPKLHSDSARTPYRGDAIQTLPSSWMDGSTTVNMTELGNSLHGVDIMTQRKKISLSTNYYQTNALSFQFDFNRETKQGNKTAGLAIGNSFATAKSAILAIPVDYVTNTGGVQVNYTKSRWTASAGYHFSKFENENSFIRWDNAFSQPAGVDTGQAAQEPGNTMQQIFLAGSYQFNKTTTTARITVGKMEQDDSFLPYSINSSLTPPAVPKTSLNGEVNTYNGIFAIVSNLNDKVRLQAHYLQNEQDNNTKRATYDYVIADTALSTTSRSNFPYSFKRRDLNVEARYKFNQQHQIVAGYENESNNRTYQVVDKTDENSLWTKYKYVLRDALDLSLQYTIQDRNGPGYHAVSELTPAENPLMRKYNMANRERNKISSLVSYNPDKTKTIGLLINVSEDDYIDSIIGLTNSKQSDYTLSYQHQVTDSTAFNIDYSLTDISSTQAGSQSFSAPTWTANNDEQIDVINFGVTRQIYRNKLDIAFNYSYVNAKGDLNVSTNSAFPTFKYSLHIISVNGEYKLKDNAAITVLFRYEKYDEENWMIDNVSQNTLDNVLSLGEVSPSYGIGIVAASYKQKF